MPEIGAQLAGYRLDGIVGRGGMGVVYLATELALDRPVALKLIAPELAGDAAFRERFLRESRIAASIDHAGILPVYAAGEADGELYLANRFVDGTDLGKLLDHGPLPPQRAVDLAGQVADALDAAHARGLVHRDVKPANVLVDGSDHCYLCDFGLTKQLGVSATTASGLAGSLDYLAPEQIRRGEVDGRTDQYALACLLYELLSGEPPFRRETEAQTLWAHMQDDTPTLRGNETLDPVLARALAKERDERYESCGAFVDAARSALGLAPSPRALRRRQRRLGRRLLAVGALLLGAAVLAIVAVTTRDAGGLQAAANSLAVLDPVSLELTATVAVGTTPTEIAVSDEWVWVVNANDGVGTISRIDAVTRQRRSTFSVAGSPRNILAAFDSLWVGTSEGRVYRVDPGTDLVEASWTLPNAGEESPFEVDQGAGWLAAGPNAVWAGSVRAISRIDPGSGQLSPRLSRFWGPMAFGFGSLWVLGEELERLSPATMAVEGTVELASGAVRVTAGLGSVWVTDEGSAVLRVDPDEEGISRTYDVGGSPFGIDVGPDAVWATNEDGEVTRIDPVSGAVTMIPVGGSPRGIGVGDGVWVSVD